MNNIDNAALQIGKIKALTECVEDAMISATSETGLTAEVEKMTNKDVYDMYYQCGKMNEAKLIQCLHTFIFDDPGMRENDMNAIVKRMEFVFADKAYGKRVDTSDKRWLDDDITDVFDGILDYLRAFR